MPAGACGLVSFNNVGGIFTVGTVPEHRRKGVATALLYKAIADSLSMSNSLLYLITTRGSEAEKLYTSMALKSLIPITATNPIRRNKLCIG